MSSEVRQTIRDTNQQIFVSAVSIWEISLKSGLGKMDLPNTSPAELPQHANNAGIELLDLTCSQASKYFTLQKVVGHRDPFDRMLICQCIDYNYTLISSDAAMAHYLEFGLKLMKN